MTSVPSPHHLSAQGSCPPHLHNIILIWNVPSFPHFPLQKPTQEPLPSGQLSLLLFTQISLPTSRFGWTIPWSVFLEGREYTSRVLVPWTKCRMQRMLSKMNSGASLVAQWLRVCLLMQGTRVRALVWEDPTCHGAAGPVSHNY